MIDALNGQSFPDFAVKSANIDNHYEAPRTQTILSSTLAYVVKTLSNRVHPISGAKIHELTSLQDLSPHKMEKYRSILPMYIRIFNAFLSRCRGYRKIIGHIKMSSDDITDIFNNKIDVKNGETVGDPYSVAHVKENNLEKNGTSFANLITVIEKPSRKLT